MLVPKSAGSTRIHNVPPALDSIDDLSGVGDLNETSDFNGVADLLRSNKPEGEVENSPSVGLVTGVRAAGDKAARRLPNPKVRVFSLIFCLSNRDLI